MNNDVVGWGDCALTNMLADQVEVVPANTAQNISANNQITKHFILVYTTQVSSAFCVL